MGRGRKLAKGTAKPPVTGKSPKNDDARIRDLEKRLAEALAQVKTRDSELGEAREQLHTRDRELFEEREQQTATSEILRVISASPTELQPVLDAVAGSSARLCGANDAQIYRVHGDVLRLVARFGPFPVGATTDTVPITRGRVVARAVTDRQTIHIHDILGEAFETDFAEAWARTQAGTGFAPGTRTVLATPLLREGVAVGVILIRRMAVQPFSDKQIELLKTFADQAVIAIENVRLFTELQEKNRALTQAHAQVTESLEQQTATSEILGVISSSPTDVQPVFEAVAQRAATLCDAYDANIFRVDGDRLWLAAHHGGIPVIGPNVPLVRGSVSGLSVIDRQPVMVADLQAEEARFPQGSARARSLGYRTTLAAPLLRAGAAIGTIVIRRTEVRPFTDRQIALLQTFADQAVIAIENVRLFKELEARNRDLTATAEILQVISRSPTDTQPVFDTIADNAVRLFRPWSVAVHRFDGELMHVAAVRGGRPGSEQYLHSGRRPTRDVMAGRCIIDRTVIHVPDFETDPTVPMAAREIARARGFRAVINVPMLKDREPIGVISVSRAETGPFSQAEIDLLQTFADQAVIAIENVRLFKELQEKNRALTEAHAQVTEALDQQTAASEILRVISSSPTDVQPVFDAIVRSAVRLCDGLHGVVDRFDGELIHFAAQYNYTPEALQMTQRMYPRQPDRKQAAGRAILTGDVVNIADVQADPEYATDLAVAGGWRSILNVPMLREGKPIGTIGVIRGQAGRFSDAQVELLRTFADQAVIAIENVRLFKELEARNRDLTQALGQQTATSEILRVISSSPTAVEPVFEAIVTSGRRLCHAHQCLLVGFDGEMLTWLASDNFSPAREEALRGIFPYRPTRAGTTGRVVLDRAVVHIPDVMDDPDHGFKEVSMRAGARAQLAVPMFREDEVIGALHVARAEPGPFSDDQIALLKTFADQAVIAIENVRLFNETKEALDQQTATSEVLRVIASSPTELKPVLDAMAESVARLCATYDAVIWRLEGDSLRVVAHHGPVGHLEGHVVPVLRGTVSGRTVLDRQTVQVTDLQAEVDEFPEGSAFARQSGHRSIVSVPLLREGVAIGVMSLRRAEVQPFTEKQIYLLKTFADQAVIAIENVRLFTELQARNRDLTEALDRQTATAEILGVISQAHTDVQPVFETIADSAVRLLGAWSALVFRYDGELIRLAAARGGLPGSSEIVMGQSKPHPPTESEIVGRTILRRAVQHIVDIETDASWGAAVRETARTRGWRSNLQVPMLSGDEVLGVIAVSRVEPGGFSLAETALLQTFADQAVIAVKNARLLEELQTRTAQLTQSVDELTALADVSRTLSSTLDLETVLQTIVSRANELAGTAGCAIWEYNEPRAEFRLRSSDYPDEVDAAALQGVDRVTTIRKGVGVTTQVFERRQAVQIHDLAVEGGEENPIRRRLIEAGHHALLAVPLLSEDEVIGVLAVTRKTPGEFPPETVRLLHTFATQSALAIQNARLFLEIADKSRQLEIASQHKSEFLANMSHELRTPLNAIIGFSEVLSERMFGELNEKQEEYLKDIYASGTHLLSLINDILDLSKIEAGRMELELTDFDLPTAIENALTLVRERAGRRSIALHTNIDDRLGQIQADERKVRQVVLNLLSNAIKFTPEGGRIDVHAVPKDGFAEVSVTDTGVGIALEDQEKVFEEFRQVGTAAKKVEGTGLGLTLCRKFVELHGGRIWVKSQEGVGSTFTFTIPVCRGE